MSGHQVNYRGIAALAYEEYRRRLLRALRPAPVWDELDAIEQSAWELAAMKAVDVFVSAALV